MRTLAPAILMLAAAPAGAQTPQIPANPAAEVVIESYYRIRWGNSAEFLRLYRANHEPILRAMQQAGYIGRIAVEEPVVHLADGPRWDLRVTIAWRDAAAALGTSKALDAAWAEATRRLYPKEAEFRAAETRRFALLDEHWDVIVKTVPAD